VWCLVCLQRRAEERQKADEARKQEEGDDSAKRKRAEPEVGGWEGGRTGREQSLLCVQHWQL